MELSVLHTGPFGVNTLVIPLFEQYVLVVDPGACSFSEDSGAITGFLKQNSLVPCACLLTHGHFDHITGTAELKAVFPDMPLVVSVQDSPMIGSGAAKNQLVALSEMGLTGLSKALAELPDADVLIKKETTLSELIPEVDSFSEGVKKALGEWCVIFTPGHTPGSVCYYNAVQNVLVSGDTVFYHSYGRTDLPGGSYSQILESLKRLYKTLPPETRVYPGHDRYGFTLAQNK